MRMRNWCFTKYNLVMPELDPTLVRYCVYQREVCPDTGREHLQGYLELKKSTRLNAVKVLLEDNTVHLEPRRGTREQARDYCMKVESRVEGTDPIEFGEFQNAQGKRNDCDLIYEMIQGGSSYAEIVNEVRGAMRMKRTIQEMVKDRKGELLKKKLKDSLAHIMLRDWQNEILIELDGQNDREILWLVDPIGGRGKSTLAKYMFCEKGALIVRAGDARDITYQYDEQEYVVFDLPRKSQFMPYTLMEMMKDGCMTSNKYETVTKVNVGIKVLVLSNEFPQFRDVSLDRWVVATFNQSGNLTYQRNGITETPEIVPSFRFPTISPRHRRLLNRQMSDESNSNSTVTESASVVDENSL